ncbi:MAG: lysine--tRNA ligase [Caldiserica bacterium]|jgi:lysyl-tRNA synthetase class 2|nr:lysine--tRNA ligase [Caldisericota bacterium]MDH7563016.1 lysine--tRNA ligase [Caldisericota bacterium]
MEEEIFRERVEKLQKLRSLGMEPYDGPFLISASAASILNDFENFQDKTVSLAGRVVGLRVHGKATFAHLDDGEEKIQVYFRMDTLGEEQYGIVAKLLDLGDILGVKGTVFKTRTGETTIAAQEFRMLSKALRNLPEKWHGLRDIELRYRQRYLDFISNKRSRDLVKLRAKVISLIRKFLEGKGFLEVETPILHPIPGGALARPFITFHNALGVNLYLRIAPELYLKRLIVGGFNKVFELGRCFRNEGISTTHNPEFTMLEVYQAYGDYREMMKLTEELISFLVKEIHGSYKVTLHGEELDFTPPWERMPLDEAFRKFAGVEILSLKDENFRLEFVREHGIKIDKKLTWANVIDEILKKRIEPKIKGPLFLYDYPEVLSPLARNKPHSPEWVERFQPIILGLEMGNAYSELADPLEQKSRFMEQAKEKERGEEEAHPMDEDFVEALEYGMPPTGGLGIGIDRLVMLLGEEDSLREVITFPTLRPK